MADASNNPTNDQQKPSDEAQANIKEEEVTMKEEEPEPVAADVLEEDDEFEEFQDEGTLTKKKKTYHIKVTLYSE